MKGFPPALLLQHFSQLCYNIMFSVTPFIWRHQSKPQTHANNNYSWNTYEVRNYYKTQFIDKKTESEFCWWENWFRNLLNRVTNWLEATDVRLNPWILGSQPQITHAHFSAVSKWTQCFCHTTNPAAGRWRYSSHAPEQFITLHSTLITTKWCH